MSLPSRITTADTAPILAAARRQWTPNPRAPKGSIANPFHQSDYERLLVGDRYCAGDHMVWAGTVCGTAGHLAMADRLRGAELASPESYWRAAKDDEEGNNRRIRYFKEANGRSNADGERDTIAKLDGLIAKAMSLGVVGKPLAVERQFLFCDPVTGDWYEGTADAVLEREDGLWLLDWKFGGRPPDIELSPQPDVYALALRHGYWAHADNLRGLHQIDWTRAEGLDMSAPTFGVWPRAFQFAWVPGIGGTQWGVNGCMALPLVEERCWAYLRDCARRWREKHDEPATRQISLEDLL